MPAPPPRPRSAAKEGLGRARPLNTDGRSLNARYAASFPANLSNLLGLGAVAVPRTSTGRTEKPPKNDTADQLTRRENV
jgi:hypothetical protein